MKAQLPTKRVTLQFDVVSTDPFELVDLARSEAERYGTIRHLEVSEARDLGDRAERDGRVIWQASVDAVVERPGEVVEVTPDD